MEDDTNKLGMTQKREVPLSLFSYIVRQGHNNVINTPQTVSLITSYTTDEAMAMISSQYLPGTQLTLELKGILPMTQVFEMFKQNIDFIKPVEPEIYTRTKKDFYKEIVEGMIKDIDAFVKTEKEKAVVLMALNKMLSLLT